MGKLGGVGVCLGHSSENYRLDAVLAKKQAAELSDWISKGACRFVAAYIILCFFSTPSVPGSTGQAAMKTLGRYQFSHALIQETLADELSTTEVVVISEIAMGSGFASVFTWLIDSNMPLGRELARFFLKLTL